MGKAHEIQPDKVRYYRLKERSLPSTTTSVHLSRKELCSLVGESGHVYLTKNVDVACYASTFGSRDRAGSAGPDGRVVHPTA